MSLSDVGGFASAPALYSADLTPEIQCTLAALADVEARYEADRERLERSAGRRASRARRLARLEAQRQEERQPLVQRLTILQQEMTTALMFQYSRPAWPRA